jgi:hypothetical protein
VDARDGQGATWKILRNEGSINHDGQVATSGKDESDFIWAGALQADGLAIL